MIAGTSSLVVRTEASDDPFTISTATLEVTKPDESVVEVAVEIDPEGAAQEHDLRAVVQFDSPGQYTLKWQYQVETETLIRVDYYQAYWGPVPEMVRTLLGLTEEDCPDQRLDQEFIAQYLILEGFYPALGSYWDLTGVSRFKLDTGISYLLAARLRPSLPKKGAIGNLIGFGQGTAKFQWESTRLPTHLLVSLEAEWEKRGWEILGLIPEIGNLLSQRRQNSTSIIAVRDNRRAEGTEWD